MSDKASPAPETPCGTLLVYADDYRHLTAEVERLRAALKEIASIGPASDAFANLELTREIARAALKEPRT